MLLRNIVDPLIQYAHSISKFGHFQFSTIPQLIHRLFFHFWEIGPNRMSRTLKIKEKIRPSPQIVQRNEKIGLLRRNVYSTEELLFK